MASIINWVLLDLNGVVAADPLHQGMSAHCTYRVSALDLRQALVRTAGRKLEDTDSVDVASCFDPGTVASFSFAKLELFTCNSCPTSVDLSVQVLHNSARIHTKKSSRVLTSKPTCPVLWDFGTLESLEVVPELVREG